MSYISSSLASIGTRKSLPSLPQRLVLPVSTPHRSAATIYFHLTLSHRKMIREIAYAPSVDVHIARKR